jgi:hypothetical protein
MAGCAQGFSAALAINGQTVEFNRIRELTVRELVDNGQLAIRGRLDHPKERVSLGRLIIGFEFTCNPSPAEMDVYLPLMGFTQSPTDTFTIGDSYTAFTSIIDRVTKVHTYTNCVMGRTVFHGQRGAQPIGMTQQVLARGFTEGVAGSFSATALDLDICYGFQEGTVTLQAATRDFDRFQLILDPHMEVQWNNSTTPTAICPTDREITLDLSTPYTSDESDLFTTPLSSVAGAAVTLAWSRGGQSTSFAFPNGKFIARPPSIPGKRQIRLPLHMRMYRSSTSAACVVTHDATP